MGESERKQEDRVGGNRTPEEKSWVEGKFLTGLTVSPCLIGGWAFWRLELVEEKLSTTKLKTN